MITFEEVLLQGASESNRRLSRSPGSRRDGADLRPLDMTQLLFSRDFHAHDQCSLSNVRTAFISLLRACSDAHAISFIGLADKRHHIVGLGHRHITIRRQWLVQGRGSRSQRCRRTVFCIYARVGPRSCQCIPGFERQRSMLSLDVPWSLWMRQ